MANWGTRSTIGLSTLDVGYLGRMLKSCLTKVAMKEPAPRIVWTLTGRTTWILACDTETIRGVQSTPDGSLLCHLSLASQGCTRSPTRKTWIPAYDDLLFGAGHMWTSGRKVICVSSFRLIPQPQTALRKEHHLGVDGLVN